MVAPETYLLIGKDSFLKKEFIQGLRDRYFPGRSDSGINFQEFTAGEHPLRSVLDFLDTVPFLSEKRLAVLWDAGALAEDEKKTLPARLDAGLLSSSVLVIASEETNTKKNAFVRELSGHCRVVPCHPPFEKDLPQWIAARAKRHGKSLERQAAFLLMERVGGQTSTLAPAIEQAAIFTADKAGIQTRDIEALFGRSLAADAFSLVDLWIEKNFARLIQMTVHLLDEGTRAFEIVAVLAGSLDRLKQAARLTAEGLSAEQITARLKLHPFFAEKLLAQARRVSAEKVGGVLRELLICDEALKTGALGERLALERFLIRVTSLGN
ncbi:MAG: DNA polymerase III subunit delta [Candidatus Omnitrophica bacterium]|nr:DNA polymerase III subunit delta [Candidatus Omnitrophota bacterium]